MSPRILPLLGALLLLSACASQRTATVADAAPPLPPPTAEINVNEEAVLYGMWAYSMYNESSGQEFTGSFNIVADESIMTVIEADIYEQPVMEEERSVSGSEFRWSGLLQGVGFEAVGTLEDQMMYGVIDIDGFGSFDLTAERN